MYISQIFAEGEYRYSTLSNEAVSPGLVLVLTMIFPATEGPGTRMV
jgi:hypothetical protein